MNDNILLNRTELKNLLKEKFKHIKIIDVRSPQEYAEQHIPEAENIPSDELFQKEMKTDEQEIIVMVCTYGGQRSQKAAEGIREKGFENVYYLEGGTKGWFEDNNDL
jgi:rhodanese-related sulfurtransferase